MKNFPSEELSIPLFADVRTFSSIQAEYHEFNVTLIYPVDFPRVSRNCEIQRALKKIFLRLRISNVKYDFLEAYIKITHSSDGNTSSPW